MRREAPVYNAKTRSLHAQHKVKIRKVRVMAHVRKRRFE